jgi:pleiotropic regulator 1
MAEEVQKHSVHTLVFRSLKRTHDMFVSNQGLMPNSEVDAKMDKMKYNIKAKDNYAIVFDRVKQANALKQKQQLNQEMNPDYNTESAVAEYIEPDSNNYINSLNPSTSAALLSATNAQQRLAYSSNPTSTSNTTLQVMHKKAPTIPKPKWHAPWKLYRVISGHLGWVRCVTVEPGNEWFATGAADRVIKIWDLASGKLKLSLTGHVSTVRGLAVSTRHPYLFSCGEDRQVKCWDLEYNKVIRHYHGHLSAVYTMALHPTIDVLVSDILGIMFFQSPL